MEFLDISSLDATYLYDAKIEQKIKQNICDFGSVNEKQGNSTPKPQNKV